MFNKDSFIHYHGSNSRTGFTPSNAVYEGFVQDAEGKPWGWLKSLNLYEQQSTGIRMDPAEFQRYNIDILGYGSNDGDGGVTVPATVVVTDFRDNSDGEWWEQTSDQAYDTQRFFDSPPITASSSYNPTGGVLAVTLLTTTTIKLWGSFGNVALSPAPPFISIYISGDESIKGWYIAEYSGSDGTYDFLRGVGETGFPSPVDTIWEAPVVVLFYDEDPGSPAAWSDYTTP